MASLEMHKSEPHFFCRLLSPSCLDLQEYEQVFEALEVMMHYLTHEAIVVRQCLLALLALLLHQMYEACEQSS